MNPLFLALAIFSSNPDDAFDRPVRVTATLTVEERDNLKADARAAHLSVSDFIRVKLGLEKRQHRQAAQRH